MTRRKDRPLPPDSNVPATRDGSQTGTYPTRNVCVPAGAFPRPRFV